MVHESRDGEPNVDPEVDLVGPVQHREAAGPRWYAVLCVIAVGGVVGAEARYGMSVLLPHHAGEWAWATVLTNMSGCLLMGVLMVVITERVRPHPLIRPLLGVGVLGGYTTFSTYAVDAVGVLQSGRAGVGLLYAVATPLLAVVAVWVGAGATRMLLSEPAGVTRS